MAAAPAKLRGCLTTLLFLALAATTWTAANRPAAGEALLDRQGLLALLEAEDYARLEAHVTGLHERYDRGDGSESALENAVAAFASADA